MSQLSKSLEKRIQELNASIESQKTELAAYERVLHMEVSKGTAPADSSNGSEAVMEAVHPMKRGRKKKAGKRGRPRKALTPDGAAEANGSGVPFAGNKTSLVADIVKSYGAAGAAPKDVDAVFSERNIKRSKNLIYNTLSYLVAHKKLKRRDGKYFIAGRSAGAAKKATKKAIKKTAPATKKTAAAATKKVSTKRRLSPEGLKRIREALKKRWAAKKAEATPAETK